jgi:hypothetical protein
MSETTAEMPTMILVFIEASIHAFAAMFWRPDIMWPSFRAFSPPKILVSSLREMFRPNTGDETKYRLSH